MSVNLLVRALWRSTCFAKPTFESNNAWCSLHFERVLSKPSVHAKYRHTRFARSAWSQLGLNMKSGLNLVSTRKMVSTWSQHGLNLVSTWSQHEKWSQLGLNMVSTRKMVSTWSQLGLNMKSGLNLVSTGSQQEKWSQLGLNLVSTWSQLCLNLDST